MKATLLLLLIFSLPEAAFARNDFWLASRYSVSLNFDAYDLGRQNAPRPQRLPLPEYPAEAIRASISGEVIADYTVYADGSIGEVLMKGGGINAFKDAVVAAFANWHFHPAVDLTTRKPVAARMRCRFRFTAIEEEEPNGSSKPAGSR